MDTNRRDKLAQLRQLLQEMKKVVLAFSGGVDSSFLLQIATEELGDNALAMTAVSSFFPAWEREEAEALAQQIGARHQLVHITGEDIQGFAHNPPDRCYHCKRTIFTHLKNKAAEAGFTRLIDGTNFDDLSDYRPGLLALQELGVRSPLKEVGLTKEEIRALSQELNLPTWDKPAYACLLSRLPYGSPITAAKLKQIDAGEKLLRRLGFKQFRLRHHGEVARLEVAPEQFALIWEHQRQIIAGLKNCGFTFVALDLEGYRTGSLNETLGPF